MQAVNVLVIFCTRSAATERLALAGAVGAVQGRANIRLRLLAETVDPEYMAPRDADAEWADAFLLGVTAQSAQAEAWLESLRTLRAQGRRIPALAASLSIEGGFVRAAMAELGIRMTAFADSADPQEAARSQGRAIADAARGERAKLHGTGV